MADDLDIAEEIQEAEDASTIVEQPRTDQEIEDAYANNAFRVIYQSNNFFLPQIQGLINGREVLNIRPEYQRRLRWANKKKSQLIESLLLNIPIPPVYLFESELARYEVMDGQQRLNAIHEFLQNEFSLVGLEKLHFLNGKRFARLPPKLRRGLERSSISAIVLLQETKGDDRDPYLVRRYVFERLNTGGEKLNAQELRNSIYRGAFNDLIVELARYPAFCRIFDIPEYSSVDENEYYENSERQRNTLYSTMGDCQLVLRFFALQDDSKISGSMRNILDRTMEERKNVDQAELDARENSFKSVIGACEEIFGDEAFLLPPNDNGTRRLSAALYDAVTVSMSRREAHLSAFVAQADEIKTRINELLRMNLELLTGRANTAQGIRERLSAVGAILDAVI
jgi:hypothetical protein